MNILILLLFIAIPFEEIYFEDIKGNKIEIFEDNYILIFLNGWNCVDCISKTSQYLKKYEVPKDRIFFVIESSQDIYSKMNFKTMIEERTNYYNSIIFNPKSVKMDDIESSLFLKYSDNNHTPAIIIKSKEYYFYQNKSLFIKGNKIELDSFGIELLLKFKGLYSK
ncbi:MAG: hypothetical protein R2863_03355 [Candidatus Kapaibacterium sp.]|nr:hypothetical protein [Ignavibacteria bacterium]